MTNNPWGGMIPVVPSLRNIKSILNKKHHHCNRGVWRNPRNPRICCGLLQPPPEGSAQGCEQRRSSSSKEGKNWTQVSHTMGECWSHWALGENKESTSLFFLRLCELLCSGFIICSQKWNRVIWVKRTQEYWWITSWTWTSLVLLGQWRQMLLWAALVSLQPANQRLWWIHSPQHLLGHIWNTVSSFGPSSSKEEFKYWRGSSRGPLRLLEDWRIWQMKKGWKN